VVPKLPKADSRVSFKLSERFAQNTGNYSVGLYCILTKNKT